MSDGIRTHCVAKPTTRIGNFAGATRMQAVHGRSAINVNTAVFRAIRRRVVLSSRAFAVASAFIEPVDLPEHLFRHLLRIAKV